MDNLQKVLVIVPAYNEEEAIRKTVENIKACNNCDVIVINDGSRDNTLQEAKKTEAIVLDLPSNLGIGGAVQAGYIYALKNDYDIAIQVDGDGQHNPIYISEMIKLITEENYDMVIGSRFISKTGYRQTFLRMLGINILSLIIKLLTGKRIYDTTSGFRAVDKEIIKYFANNYPYDYPEPDTNMQMILKGMKIKEIPVQMNKRETRSFFYFTFKVYQLYVKRNYFIICYKNKKDVGGEDNMIYVFAIVFAIVFEIFILNLVRRNKLDEKYSILWIILGIIILFVAIFPNSIITIAGWFNVYYPPTLMLLFALMVLGVYIIHISIVITKQNKMIVKLTQELAIVKEKMEKKD